MTAPAVVELADGPPQARLAHGGGRLDLDGVVGAVLAGAMPPLLGPEVFSERSRHIPPAWLRGPLGRTRELLVAGGVRCTSG